MKNFKRKLFVVLVVLTASLCFIAYSGGNVMANTGHEKFGSFTKYEDKKNGYSGWACASYCRNDEFLQGFIRRRRIDSVPYSKLTYEESFLMWSALDEYDYKKGEIYIVEIRDNPSEFKRELILIVTIISKNSLDWFGFLILN